MAFLDVFDKVIQQVLSSLQRRDSIAMDSLTDDKGDETFKLEQKSVSDSSFAPMGSGFFFHFLPLSFDLFYIFSDFYVFWLYNANLDFKSLGNDEFLSNLRASQ